MSVYPATAQVGHRLNAFRLNYLEGRIYITIGGGAAGAYPVLVDSLTINDRLNEIPNTLVATVRGTAPIEGQVVRVTLGSQNGIPLFVGNVLRVSRVWAAKNPAHLLYHIEATDPTWRLNAVLFSARYKNQSASAIAADILTRAPAGFTAKIEAGLPVLDEISFTNVAIMDALTQLATRIGGYTLCDYLGAVYLFTTPDTTSPPAALNAAHTSLAGVSYVRDLTQIITRAVVEGGGGNALTNLPAGTTSIPVDVIGWYSSAGGYVRSGPQRIAYTGIAAGGAGAFAGEGTTPTSAPTVAPAGHTAAPGLEPGTHSYAYTWVTGNGESLPSPLAAVLMEGPRPALSPGAGLAGSAAVDGALTVGAAYTYAYSFSAAAAAGDVSGAQASALSVTSAATAGARAQPAAPRLATETNPNVAGNQVAGATYTYGYTFSMAATWSDLSAATESALSVVAARVIGTRVISGTTYAEPVAVWVNMPAGGPAYKWIHLWRSPANGGAGALKWIGAQIPYIAGAGEQYYLDTLADSNLQPQTPAAGVLSQAIVVTVPAAAAVGAYLWIHVWRSPANGGAAGLKWTGAALPFAAGVAATWTDTLADGSLTAAAPPAQGVSVNQASVAGVAPGPLGVSSRKVYRTAANAAQLKLLATLADNSTTTLPALDTTPDAGLGANAPTVDTAGIVQTAKIIPAGSSAIRLTSTGPFASAGGYAIVGNGQVVRYTGLTATDLTGIPPIGVDGALVQSVPWGTAVTVAPALLGTTGVVWPLLKGDPVNVVALVNDTAAQSALAALIGGDGVRESLLQDGRISLTEATARGRALLAGHKSVRETFAHKSRDINTRSGATVAVDLPAPTDIHGVYRLQDVTISTFNPRGIVPPTFDSTSSSQRFTFEDLLRQVANTTPAPSTGEDR
jgi:hypothetical protein